MTGLLILGILLLGGAGLALAYSLDLMPANDHDVRARVQVARAAEPDETVTRTAREVTDGARRPWISERKLLEMERNVLLAGRSRDILKTLVMAKLLVPIGVGLFGLLFVPGMGGIFWLFYVGAIVAGYITPDIFIRGRATEHQAELTRDLPDLLDQITIALDAGMSFEAAFTRIGTKHKGPLGPQISRTVQDMAMGIPRREAYLTLAARNECEDLNKFIKSLIQAEEFGVPIANVVRLQANEMRDKRRQRASAAARTVPTKLLFPMLVCLFPVLFMVILTPGVMSLGALLG